MSKSMQRIVVIRKLEVSFLNILLLQHLQGPLLSIVKTFSNLADGLESCVCFIRLENLVYYESLFIKLKI